MIPDSVKVMHTEPIESIKPQQLLQQQQQQAQQNNAVAKANGTATGNGITSAQANGQNEKYAAGDPLDPRLRQAFKDALIASQEAGTKVKVS